MRDTRNAQSTRQQNYGPHSGTQSPRPKPPNPPADEARPGRHGTGSEEFSQRSGHDEPRRQRPPPERPMPPRAPPRAGFDPANAAADEGPAATHAHYDRASRRSPPPPPPTQMPGSYPHAPPRTQGSGTPTQAPTARRPHPDHLPHLHNLRTDDVPFVEGSRTQTPYMAHSGEKTYFSSDGLRTPASGSRSREDDPRSSRGQPQQSADRRRSDSPPHKIPGRSATDGTRPAEKAPQSINISSSSEDSDDTDIESGLSGTDLKNKTRRKAQPSSSWTKRSAAGPLPTSNGFEESQGNGAQPNSAPKSERQPESMYVQECSRRSLLTN